MFSPDELSKRNAFADAAKAGQWEAVFTALQENPAWVNSTRPGGFALFTPLHQAAYQGASQDIVMRLIKFGAMRTLMNARGERPVDVAERRGNKHLLRTLASRVKHSVPNGVLAKLQEHFHQVILGRIDKPLAGHQLRLPELACLLELKRPAMWFPVPGMYGGFSYELRRDGVDPMLVVESWSRVDGGSVQRHEITTAGSAPVEEGSV